MMVKGRKLQPLSRNDKEEIIERIAEEIYLFLDRKLGEENIDSLSLKVELEGDYYPIVVLEADISINPFKLNDKELKDLLDEALEHGFNIAEKMIKERRKHG
ncbi:MAG: hypothetical protein J7L38_08515 [Thermoproteales archaeon]|nr:hypothetical protein [Thermoproteales archaeon]RLE66183.1 MAG: hypothetical protein DRJ47_02985 [Thermoprotei archaeon]